MITFPKLIDLHIGDAATVIDTLPTNQFHSCITSPPYFSLRNYDVSGQLGRENTIGEYIASLVDVFKSVRRVLRDDGTVWLNLGDTYAQKRLGTLAPKNLIGVPWRVAFALQDDGWILRSDVIWEKPNAMPVSVQDRPTTSHEHIFLFAKSTKYYYDIDAIREPFKTTDEQRLKLGKPIRIRNVGGRTDGFTRTASAMSFPEGGRNKRTVWSVPTQPAYGGGGHFAAYPPDLIEPCVLASCPSGGYILDPFGGTGTTGLVAAKNNRHATLIEINPQYAMMIQTRLADFF